MLHLYAYQVPADHHNPCESCCKCESLPLFVPLQSIPYTSCIHNQVSLKTPLFGAEVLTFKKPFNMETI